ERDRAGTRLQSLGERLAFDELHDDGVALVVAAGEDVVDAHDGRMAERRRRAGLAAQALAGAAAGTALGAYELDRHAAVEPLVVGGEDLAHAAAPQPAFDPVGAEALGHGLGHGSPLGCRPSPVMRRCSPRGETSRAAAAASGSPAAPARALTGLGLHPK